MALFLKKVVSDKRPVRHDGVKQEMDLFSFNFAKFLTDSSIKVIFSAFQLSFKVNRVQTFDGVRFYVVESRIIRVLRLKLLARLELIKKIDIMLR